MLLETAIHATVGSGHSSGSVVGATMRRQAELNRELKTLLPGWRKWAYLATNLPYLALGVHVLRAGTALPWCGPRHIAAALVFSAGLASIWFHGTQCGCWHPDPYAALQATPGAGWAVRRLAPAFREPSAPRRGNEAIILVVVPPSGASRGPAARCRRLGQVAAPPRGVPPSGAGRGPAAGCHVDIPRALAATPRPPRADRPAAISRRPVAAKSGFRAQVDLHEPPRRRLRREPWPLPVCVQPGPRRTPLDERRAPDARAPRRLERLEARAALRALLGSSLDLAPRVVLGQLQDASRRVAWVTFVFVCRPCGGESQRRRGAATWIFRGDDSNSVARESLGARSISNGSLVRRVHERSENGDES